MDLVQQMQRQLYELRNKRSEVQHDFTGQHPQDVVNTIIADVMNLLETLYVALNLPEDGFVSHTQGAQDVNTDEEASSSRM